MKSLEKQTVVLIFPAVAGLVWEKVLELSRQSYQYRFLKKSTRNATRELQTPQSTVVKILHKSLKLHVYIY